MLGAACGVPGPLTCRLARAAATRTGRARGCARRRRSPGPCTWRWRGRHYPPRPSAPPAPRTRASPGVVAVRTCHATWCYLVHAFARGLGKLAPTRGRETASPARRAATCGAVGLRHRCCWGLGHSTRVCVAVIAPRRSCVRAASACSLRPSSPLSALCVCVCVSERERVRERERGPWRLLRRRKDTVPFLLVTVTLAVGGANAWGARTADTPGPMAVCDRQRPDVLCCARAQVWAFFDAAGQRG